MGRTARSKQPVLDFKGRPVGGPTNRNLHRLDDLGLIRYASKVNKSAGTEKIKPKRVLALGIASMRITNEWARRMEHETSRASKEHQ